MPAPKGRKKRQAREQRRGAGGDDTAGRAATATALDRQPMRRPETGGPLPSTTARVTGFMIAIITAFLAVLMVYQSVSDDPSGIDGLARIAGGSVLVVLAVVVGVLSVVPGQVRDWFARRR